MDVQRRAPAGVALVIAAVALITVGPGASSAGSTPTAGVNGASGSKLVRFFRPTGDTLFEKGSGPIRVIVQLRAGARLTKVDVDGVNVTRLLRPGPGGYYGAILSLGSHLHYGFNDAFAQATGRDGRRATVHVRFIGAKRDDSLLRLTSFSTQTAAAPLQVAVRDTTGTHVRATLSVADGVSARVYVNDRRVDRAFSQQGKLAVVRLGAGEGLRFGRNLVQILVHKTHPHKRQSSYDLESRTVVIGRNAPIASAGADRTITQGGFLQLDGRATKLPPGFARPSFRWRIASAPRGSKARLRNATGSRPTLVPDRPGVYDVHVSVRGTPRRPSGGLGARDASDSGTSNDTAVLTVQPNIPPVGLPLDTISSGLDNSILLGGQRVPGTYSGGYHETKVSYAVLDRQTLEVKTSGSLSADVAGIQQLGRIIDGYSGSLDYLVVLNWSNFGDDIAAERAAFDTVLQKIGEKPTDDERQLIRHETFGADVLPASAVGVAGAPAGSAFILFAHSSQNHVPGMSGYLRLNGVTEKYDFVYTDPVDFDTEPNQTPTDNSPAQLTFKVGEKTYTDPNPGGGVSGFHLLILDANTLEERDQGVYTTNAADGAEQPTEVQRLASELSNFNLYHAGSLVMLQAFGAPHGNDGPWDQVAQQIERLGGTRQVFDALNTVDPRPLNGEDPNRKGPYAFVGRVNESAPRAEQSYPLNGLPGRLRGVLMRARNAGYEPMIAAPPRRDGQSPVNTELLDIANQAPQPFPAFKDTTGALIAPGPAQAVQKFLGVEAGLCSAALPVCDIRESYYQNYRANWSSIQSKLENLACPNGPGFTETQCNGIRKQLSDEAFDVAKVTHYFGPLGLQQPFGAAGVGALANLGQISNDILGTVNAPGGDNTSSNVFQVMSYVMLVATYIPNPATPEVILAGTLYAAFSAGAYFTRDNGSPDLIGPQVTTAASKLGVELADRYEQAGDNLDDLGRLIVSDYGKLTTVASKVDAQPGPGETDWRLGNVGQARDELELAAQQTIYERLVPLVYPFMYKLGGWANAHDWYCYVPWPYPDRYLFHEQGDSAQFVGRYPGATTVAVAKASYTGSGGGARVAGIPGSIADQLFKPVAQGGLGLSKLQFYSPRNGFRYVSLDQLRAATGIAPFCSEVPDPPGNGH